MSPFSDFSSIPDTKLDWLLADEGGANRLLSSSLPWVTSPLSELFRESLRAERDEDVLLLSLRGLLEFRPVQIKHRKQNVIHTRHTCHRFFALYLASAVEQDALVHAPDCKYHTLINSEDQCHLFMQYKILLALNLSCTQEK